MEQNFALTLGEKVDYDINSPSTPSTEPEETPSEVDIEEKFTGKQIDLTDDSKTKKKRVFKAIKSTAKTFKNNPLFRRKQNFSENNLQNIQETSASPFLNSQSQTDPINGAAKSSEAVAEQAKITQVSSMHKIPISNHGEATDNVCNHLRPDSLLVAGKGTTTTGSRITPRPGSLLLAEGGATGADCSAEPSVLSLSIAGRDPTDKHFFCPITPRVIIFLVHKAEMNVSVTAV